MTVSKLRSLALLGAAAAILGCLGLLGSARISRADLPAAESTANADAKSSESEAPACQVTVIAILVSRDEMKDGLDPRLEKIKKQLRKLIPENHGIKLLDVQQSDSLSVDQAVTCKLGDGRLARVTLIDPPNPEGKVKIRCELTKGKNRLSVSEVATPMNQLFFCEHTLEDGSKFLIGIGAR